MVRASARRLLAQHGAKAADIARERMDASMDAAEAKMWRAIITVIENTLVHQRV